ncbi:ribonuclease P protein component [bacterium]|nr:ribonuclease P protein component [bacterium]
MLQKRYRLPAKLFKHIYDKGKKYRSEVGMLIALPYAEEITPKFGFVVSKKVGNAPARHRMTRVLRAIVHESVDELELKDNGYIYEFIAFKFCDDYSALKEVFQSLLKQSLNDKEDNS